MAKIPVLGISKTAPAPLQAPYQNARGVSSAMALGAVERTTIAVGSFLQGIREKQIRTANQSSYVKFTGEAQTIANELTAQARSRQGEKALHDDDGNPRSLTDWATGEFKALTAELINKENPQVQKMIEDRMPGMITSLQYPLAIYENEQHQVVAAERIDATMKVQADAVMGKAGLPGAMEDAMLIADEDLREFAAENGWTAERTNQYMADWNDIAVSKAIRALGNPKEKRYAEAKALLESFDNEEDAHGVQFLSEATERELKSEINVGLEKTTALGYVSKAESLLSNGVKGGPMTAEGVTKAWGVVNGIVEAGGTADQRDYAQTELGQLIDQRAYAENMAATDLGEGLAVRLRAGSMDISEITPAQERQMGATRMKSLESIADGLAKSRLKISDTATANVMFYLRDNGTRMATPQEIAEFDMTKLLPILAPDDWEAYWKVRESNRKSVASGKAPGDYRSDKQRLEWAYMRPGYGGASLDERGKKATALITQEYGRRVEQDQRLKEVTDLPPERMDEIAEGLHIEVEEVGWAAWFDKTMESTVATQSTPERLKKMRTKMNLEKMDPEVYTDIQMQITKVTGDDQVTEDEVSNYIAMFQMWRLPDDERAAMLRILDPPAKAWTPEQSESLKTTIKPVMGEPIEMTPFQEDEARGVLLNSFGVSEPDDNDIREMALTLVSQRAAAEEGLPVEWLNGLFAGIDISIIDPDTVASLRRFDALRRYVPIDEALDRAAVPTGMRTAVSDLLEGAGE